MIFKHLLRKHHGRTGVDWQGQPVVQVHVLQPVVIDLNVNTGTAFEKCFFVKCVWTQVITFRVETCAVK